jgi:hypothetical protein
MCPTLHPAKETTSMTHRQAMGIRSLHAEQDWLEAHPPFLPWEDEGLFFAVEGS